MEAVAAHGSKSRSGRKGVVGVVVLIGGRLLDDDERCRAKCPVDIAETPLPTPMDGVNV